MQSCDKVHTVVPIFTPYFKTTLDYKTARFGPKGQFSVLNGLYFKITCNIRPHFLGPMGGLKIEGPLYWYIVQRYKILNKELFWLSLFHGSLMKNPKMKC